MPDPVGRLRITPRSIIGAVLLVTVASLAIGVLGSAQKVLGWVLLAGMLAGLLLPVVEWLDRRIPRGLAVAIVTIGFLALLGGITYGVVNNVLSETRALQDAAPKAAAEIEQNSKFARDLGLAQKTKEAVDKIPEELTGGTSGVIRTAADLALTASIVAILAVFFVLSGGRMVNGAIRQVRHPERRAWAKRVVPPAMRNALSYLRRTLILAVGAGLVSFLMAMALGLPAPVALSTWVAVWSVVPLGGVIIGGVPIVGIALVKSTTASLLLALVLVGYQVGGGVVRHFWIDTRTVHVGPFLGLAAVFGGLEWRGAAGALLALLFVAGISAVVERVAAEAAPDPIVAPVS
jgi:predicted PurR-regulated permease PerM